MNPFSVPSLICAVLFLFLGIAVVSYNPKAKLNLILGVLSFNWILFAVSLFMLHLSENAIQASFWNKWPYALLLPSLIIMIYYSIALNKLEKKWGEKIAYLPLKAHFFVFSAIAMFFWATVIFSDLLIAPPERHPLTFLWSTFHIFQSILCVWVNPPDRDL